MRGRVLSRRLHEVLTKMFLLAVFVVLELAHGKIYDRCELARELKYVHEAPDHQLATWVCIAEHESQYNTSIVGHLNGDGSGDHGIFQISDKFWCSPPGKGLACGLTCAELEDEDIADDFICAQKIYREHKQLSGDGFNAWAVYKPHCKGPKADRYLKDCFDAFEGPKTFTNPAPAAPAAHGFFNTPAGRANKVAAISTQTTTSAPFPSFRSFSDLQNQELITARPGINSFSLPKSSFFQNNRFFTSTEVPRVDFFTPTTTFKPTFTTRTTFTPRGTTSTSGFVAFNPTATIQSVTPTTESPAPFGFGRTLSTATAASPFAPTTRYSAFPQSTTVSRPRPVFIINGVKWY